MYICVYMCVYECVREYRCIYIYIYIYVCVCVCVYTYIHTCTDTHILKVGSGDGSAVGKRGISEGLNRFGNVILKFVLVGFHCQLSITQTLPGRGNIN
jgi:preprotein translocase subunit SecG